MLTGMTKIGLWTLGGLFALFNLLGFFGVPYAVHQLAEQKLGPLLSRPVSTGEVRFNPYILRLEIENIHVGEVNGTAPFVDLDRLLVNVSWESLFRLSPIVEELVLDVPQINIVRSGAQQFNFTDLVEKFSQPASPDSGNSSPVEFSVANIHVNSGRIVFDDQLLHARHVVDQLQIGVPVVGNFPALTDVFVQPLLQARVDGSPLRMEGETKPFSSTRESEIRLQFDKLDLPLYLGYVPQKLPVDVTQGRLSANVAIAFAQTARKPTIHLRATTEIRDLAVKDRQGQPLLDVAAIQLSGLSVDPLNGELNLNSVQIEHPALVLTRDRKGILNLARLAPASPASKPEKTAHEEKPFKFHVASVALSDASVSFADASNSAEVTLQVSPLKLTVQDLSEDFSQPVKFDLAGTLNGKGQFSVTGSSTISPLNLTMKLDSELLDAAAFEPYFGSRLNASLARAYLSAKGDVSLTQAGKSLRASYDGDAALNDVRLLDKATADLFAGWQALRITGIKADYGESGTDVQIGRVALSKFYARIFLDQKGQLNLSRLVAQESAPAASLTRADQPAAEPVVKTSPSKAEEGTASPPFNLHFGQITFDAGRVNFTDNFIKPNYSANLGAIQGRIGAFGTRSTRPASVDLKAKLNANDRVAINGSVNPLIDPPYVDLTATARDVVMTNFTPYTSTYTGYPIVAGKLSVDLHYLLDKQQLNAINHIFIQQLTFGDHVDSPTATNLPVRLAVSLLKNARGEIDVNVPVSGSVSDPKFSLGSVIWGAFVNLIEKAVTAPFTLLASAFGGSDELGYVEFAPGSSALSAAAAAKLETLSKALADRPEIKLSLSGRVDPAFDGPALREAYVERQIRLQKTRAVVGKGESVDVENVSVTPAEYGKFLLKAYETADFKKERNVIGMLKSLPPEEMKRLLIASAPVASTDFQQLAQRRAEAVGQWFEGKIDPGRVYVVASRLSAEGIQDKGQTTRVDFGLQ